MLSTRALIALKNFMWLNSDINGSLGASNILQRLIGSMGALSSKGSKNPSYTCSCQLNLSPEVTEWKWRAQLRRIKVSLSQIKPGMMYYVFNNWDTGLCRQLPLIGRTNKYLQTGTRFGPRVPTTTIMVNATLASTNPCIAELYKVINPQPMSKTMYGQVVVLHISTIEIPAYITQWMKWVVSNFDYDQRYHHVRGFYAIVQLTTWECASAMCRRWKFFCGFFDLIRIIIYAILLRSSSACGNF